MNVIVFVYDGDDVNKLSECVSTFKKHAAREHRLVLYCRTEFDLPVEHLRLSPLWDGRRMTHRMEIIKHLPANDGDQIISCDVDVCFQGDPFKVFESPFDLFYTSRGYQCDSPVNAGVWGVRKTTDAKRLLNFMIDQANAPTWAPYLSVRKRLERLDRNLEVDWWANQDLLCAFREAGAPFGTIHDAGPRFNCCPETGPHLPLTDTVIADFKGKIGNPQYVIIHYKELEGRL